MRVEHSYLLIHARSNFPASPLIVKDDFWYRVYVKEWISFEEEKVNWLFPCVIFSPFDEFFKRFYCLEHRKGQISHRSEELWFNLGFPEACIKMRCSTQMIYYGRIFRSNQKRQRVGSPARKRCQQKVLQRADTSLIREEPTVECKLHLLV